MKKREDVGIPFPPLEYGFDGITSSLSSLDPLGSYTGRTLDSDEIPVQDADDL